MNDPDRAVLDDLVAVVGRERVRDSLADRIAHDCDASPIFKSRPLAVVSPRSRDEVVAVVQALSRHGVPFIGRGAGTGLSGGATAEHDGVIVSLAGMRRILEIDPESRIAVVEPGVINATLSAAASPHGLAFAPDPSSQSTCTIGGNVAENSGGPHTLKCGVTTNHVLGLEVVLPTGEITRMGGRGVGAPGLDLVGLFCGSEGTLGLATEITVKLTPVPSACRTLLAVFGSVAAATRAVTEIIAAGIVPAALEMLDGVMLGAINRAFGMGFPEDAGALLLIEVDGVQETVDEEAHDIEAIVRGAGATSVEHARDAAERAQLWRARKQAFGAVGRLTPGYLTQDGVVPRSRLPEALERIGAVAARHGLEVANVFHAGDGNLHPCLFYDPAAAGARERVIAAGEEILDVCMDLGGSITGEHGVGLEKREALARMFAPADLEAMRAIRAVFDPAGLANPHKALPWPGGCGETRALASHVEAH